MSDDVPPTPDLRGVIEWHVGRAVRAAQSHGPQPAKVLAYDAAAQTVNVEPLIDVVTENTEGGTTARARPILQGIPVLFMRGAGGGLTYPVKAGDIALVVPCGASILRWFTRGGELERVDPGYDRPSMQDAFAIVGGHTRSRKATTAPDDAVVLHADTGVETRIGSASASQSVIRGEAFQSALDTLLGALNTFAGTCTTTPPGAATTLAAAVTAFQAAWSANLSSVAKVP